MRQCIKLRQFMGEAVFKKGSEVILTIDGLALGGKGFSRRQNYVFFVERGLPGQIVRVMIKKVKPNYAEARVLEVLTESQDAMKPVCSHFGVCGGCLLQNLRYEKQLESKRNQVTETLRHLGGFLNFQASEALGSPDSYFYRNKMEYSFSDSRWLAPEEMNSGNTTPTDNFSLGLHVSERHDKVLDIDACYLCSEESNGILNAVRDWTKYSDVPPYSLKQHTGFWRFLVFRRGIFTSDFMINLVTANEPSYFQAVDRLSDHISANFPFVSTIVHNINRKKAQIAVGDEQRVIYGPGYITEKLNSNLFRISANSFFQTNSKQAVHLYEKIIELGEFTDRDIVYDLYSGTGSIAVTIAKQVQRVIGIELVEAAIDDAEKNCQLNTINNCVFIQGDLKDVIVDTETLISSYGRPDKIIIDPPRSGMHPDVPEMVMKLNAERIIYVSCNPATMARDLKELCNQQYDLKAAFPVDMFPHTPHCEVVSLLIHR